MKTVNVKINLYSFNELSEEAKQKAIENQRNFELSTMQPEDFISGDAEYDTPEQLEKAYNEQYSYYESDDTSIIENIEANEYVFFENGEMAECVTYTGNQPKAGTTEFNFMGNVYNI